MVPREKRKGSKDVAFDCSDSTSRDLGREVLLLKQTAKANEGGGQKSAPKEGFCVYFHEREGDRDVLMCGTWKGGYQTS